MAVGGVDAAVLPKALNRKSTKVAGKLYLAIYPDTFLNPNRISLALSQTMTTSVDHRPETALPEPLTNDVRTYNRKPSIFPCDIYYCNTLGARSLDGVVRQSAVAAAAAVLEVP